MRRALHILAVGLFLALGVPPAAADPGPRAGPACTTGGVCVSITAGSDVEIGWGSIRYVTFTITVVGGDLSGGELTLHLAPVVDGLSGTVLVDGTPDHLLRGRHAGGAVVVDLAGSSILTAGSRVVSIPVTVGGGAGEGTRQPIRAEIGGVPDTDPATGVTTSDDLVVTVGPPEPDLHVWVPGLAPNALYQDGVSGLSLILTEYAYTAVPVTTTVTMPAGLIFESLESYEGPVPCAPSAPGVTTCTFTTSDGPDPGHDDNYFGLDVRVASGVAVGTTFEVWVEIQPVTGRDADESDNVGVLHLTVEPGSAPTYSPDEPSSSAPPPLPGSTPTVVADEATDPSVVTGPQIAVTGADVAALRSWGVAALLAGAVLCVLGRRRDARR